MYKESFLQKILSILVLVATIATSATARAEVIGSGIWSPVHLADISNDGRPFWDNVSYDGASCNIGFLLKGTSGCGGFGGFNINYLEFYHNDGAAVEFLFQDMLKLTYLGGITAKNTENRAELWGPWVPQTKLFGSSLSPGDSFDISRKFMSGMMYTVGYFPTKEFDTTGPLTSLFAAEFTALFRLDTPYYTTYYLAFEDMESHEGPDGDDQDAVFAWVEIKNQGSPFPIPFQFNSPYGYPTDKCVNSYEDEAPCGLAALVPTDPGEEEPVPEPVSLAMLALGLLSAKYVRRRRN